MRVSFFFFKQKTAYERRISDWSSDVCSSDLEAQLFRCLQFGRGGAATLAQLDELRRVAIVHRRGLRDRVIGRDRHETCAENRVRPGGIDRQLITVAQG